MPLGVGSSLSFSIQSLSVALRVRAWIETKDWNDLLLKESVALRVRAWIETDVLLRINIAINGRPPREGVD